MLNNIFFQIPIHIQELGKTLYENECPSQQVYAQKVLRPPDGSFHRIHQPAFPRINSEKVELIITDGMRKNCISHRLTVLRNQMRIIPMGPRLPEVLDVRPAVLNSARRLEVFALNISCILKKYTCISFYFIRRCSKLVSLIFSRIKSPMRVNLCRL